MSKFKTPIRYPGGKSRLAKKIVQNFPSSWKKKKSKTYREPFVGGGSVFFEVYSSLRKGEYYEPGNIQMSIGDSFEPLVDFWYVAKHWNPEMLIVIKNWKSTFDSGKELFNHCKEILNNEELHEEKSQLKNHKTKVRRAAAFFILNRITFSGLTLSGGFSQASFETRFLDSHIKKLKETRYPLKYVDIVNDDYKHLLHKESEEEQNVLIYLDPPYDIETETLYGKRGNKHKGFDHEEFAKECKKCKHQWIISYNDNDNIRELFDWANIKEIDVTYNMNSNNKKKKELLIMNY